MRVVAEQSEIRPSFTSLTSFTSNIDMEEVYHTYNEHTNSLETKHSGSRDPQIYDSLFCGKVVIYDHVAEKQRESRFDEPQLPPSYEDLLK